MDFNGWGSYLFSGDVNGTSLDYCQQNADMRLTEHVLSILSALSLLPMPDRTPGLPVQYVLLLS